MLPRPMSTISMTTSPATFPPYYAEQFIDRLIEAINVLKDHPQLGRRVPEAEEREDVRELIFQSYRIISFFDADQVHILTVLHGSRDLGGQAAKPWDVG